MGKTVKKLYSQRRHHERVAVSVLPETREQVYARVYKGVSVEFTAGPGDASPQSRGVAGEFRVFEELRRCVRDSASPLFGAHLAPNLYLPIPDCGRGASQPIWRQVNLVLITCEGVFVIEAKNKGTKVLTSPDFASLAVESRDGTRRSARWILDQCAGHADALSGATGVSWAVPRPPGVCLELSLEEANLRVNAYNV